MPRAAALAVAAPIEGEMLTFMNSDWRIGRASIAADLGLDSLTLLNDFGAAAQAVSELETDELVPLWGATHVGGETTGLEARQRLRNPL